MMTKPKLYQKCNRQVTNLINQNLFSHSKILLIKIFSNFLVPCQRINLKKIITRTIVIVNQLILRKSTLMRLKGCASQGHVILILKIFILLMKISSLKEQLKDHFLIYFLAIIILLVRNFLLVQI